MTRYIIWDDEIDVDSCCSCVVDADSIEKAVAHAYEYCFINSDRLYVLDATDIRNNAKVARFYKASKIYRDAFCVDGQWYWSYDAGQRIEANELCKYWGYIRLPQEVRITDNNTVKNHKEKNKKETNHELK